MAVCTSLVSNSGSLMLAIDSSVSDPANCPGPVALTGTEYTEWLAQSVAWGFDQDLFEQAFGAGLLLFVTGLGIGLIISTVRKMRAG